MRKNSISCFVGKGIPAGLAVIALIWILSSCGNSGQDSSEGVIQADIGKTVGEEIFYDDGFPESQHSPWSNEPGGQLAVVFTPTVYPSILTKVRFLVGINGIPTTKFRVRVFGGTLAEGPDESQDLLESEVIASAPFGNKWVEVDLSDQNVIITHGDFCVSMEWLVPPGDDGRNAQFIGVDHSKPDRRSWWRTDSSSKWVKIEEVANIGDRDVMIRVTLAEK